MVPSRHAQKAARRGGESPSPTGPRERDTKGANDAKQRRKVEPADLDAARRTSEEAMRRLSTQDKDDLPRTVNGADLPQAAARPAPVAVAETASSPGARTRKSRPSSATRHSVAATRSRPASPKTSTRRCRTRRPRCEARISCTSSRGNPMPSSRPSSSPVRRRSRSRTHEVGWMLH